MACTDYKRLISPYVDGELPPEHADLVKDHLPDCDSCRKSVRLLRLEDRAVQSALLGVHAIRSRRRKPRKLVTVAALVIILLGGSLFLLYGVYEGLGRTIRQRNAKADAVAAAIEKKVLVTAEAMPILEFVDRLSALSDVPILLHPDAAGRVGYDTLVSLPLVEPIRLESVLLLLGEFHGLAWKADDGNIVLE
jgi:hypothetical protein